MRSWIVQMNNKFENITKIFALFFLFFLMHCEVSPDSVTDSSKYIGLSHSAFGEERVEIPYFKQQYRICSQGSDFDLNKSCQSISHEYVSVCLTKAKQACQKAVLCAQNAFFNIILPEDHLIMTFIGAVEDGPPNRTLFAQSLSVKEYEKTAAECSKETFVEFNSFLRTYKITEENKP